MTVHNQGECCQLQRLPSSFFEAVEQELQEIVCDLFRCSCGGMKAWTIDRDGFVAVRHVAPPGQGAQPHG